MAKKKENKKKPVKKYEKPLKIKEGSFNEVLKVSGKPKEEKK